LARSIAALASIVIPALVCALCREVPRRELVAQIK